MTKTKVGIPSNLYCWTLRKILEKESKLELDVAPLPDVARKLRHGDLHAAFVSPVEYARESSEYRILPSVAVSSRAGVALYVRKGLRDIRTLAADPSYVSEIVLARIVLAEEFERIPAIVPVIGPLEQMLARADSALIAGDALLSASRANPDNIDLAELWSEMVDLPYVHGFFGVREGTIEHEAVLQIRSVVEAGKIERYRQKELPHSDYPNNLPQDEVNRYLDLFSYELTKEVEAGLQEFLHYAHYHGVLADIPDLRFYPNSLGDDEFDPLSSMN